MTATIGLFYGSTEGASAAATKWIKEAIEAMGLATVDVHPIGYTDLKEMERYDYLILGISTWDIGQLQADWAAKFEQMDTISLNGKPVGLYGMGDLSAKVIQRGAEPVGFWLAAESYEFEYSAP